jgi:ABC-type transport system involved in Fe-S cluster assembly fused permease/ATPase subunit
MAKIKMAVAFARHRIEKFLKVPLFRVANTAVETSEIVSIAALEFEWEVRATIVIMRTKGAQFNRGVATSSIDRSRRKPVKDLSISPTH